MKLSILIATVLGREHFFNSLVSEFNKQIIIGGFQRQVEIVSKKDNKEMSIGDKRQWLIENCNGEYVVMFDDDDHPFEFYLSEIMKALKDSPDCVGFLIHMTTNGQKPQTCCHSLRHKVWENNVMLNRQKYGYDYARNVTHFNPVKRKLALAAGYKDMRHGEDEDYSNRVTLFCKTEVFINKRLFHYRYVNTQNFNEKYGIKQ